MTPGIRIILLAALFTAPVFAADPTLESGIEAFRQGRYSLAISQLRQSTDERGRVFFSLSLAGAGKCADAIPGLTRPAIQDPALARLAALAVVKCRSSLNDNANADRELDDLQQRFPSDPDVLYLAAKLHMKAFNDASLAMFQKAPNSYRVHELSAEIFEIDSRFTEAAAEYRKAIELNPAAPDLHFRLGRALLLRNHDPETLDDAATQFREELRLSPEDSASEFQLGQIALVKGDVTGSRLALQRALQLSPDFVQALIALAKLDMREKNYLPAIALLQRAAASQPENEAVHYTLMTAFRNSGDTQRAKSEKAILDRLNQSPRGEFSDFLKKLEQKPAAK